MGNVVDFPGKQNEVERGREGLTFEDFAREVETPWTNTELHPVYEISWDGTLPNDFDAKVTSIKRVDDPYITLYGSGTTGLYFEDENGALGHVLWEGQERLEFENVDTMKVAFTEELPEVMLQKLAEGKLGISWC